MTQPNTRSGAPRRAPRKPDPSHEPERKVWMPAFLAALAETSNVTRAANRARISTATAYASRRRNRDFARQWQSALCEGYDNLEMELLGRLREGEIKRAAGAKIGARTFDNSTAYRLLMVHREAAMKEKAQRANVSAAEVRASIERKVAAVKEQVLARLEAEGKADDE